MKPEIGMMHLAIESTSPQMTKRMGSAFARYLLADDCIALTGGMGSGKTCFVQGIAEGLGVPRDVPVTSPSFTLVNRYRGRLILFHVDLYRLDQDTDFDDLELDEIVHDDGVVVIEWPQIAMPRLSKIDLRITFSWDMRNENIRRLEFASDSERFNPYFIWLEHDFPGN
jgi:tRNA threonylcarbamoyladenosine biosynthesis protein TsaE